MVQNLQEQAKNPASLKILCCLKESILFAETDHNSDHVYIQAW